MFAVLLRVLTESNLSEDTGEGIYRDVVKHRQLVGMPEGACAPP